MLERLAHKYLLDKRSSKTNHLEDFNFQEYLSSKLLTLRQKRLLLKFRIRMVSEIRDNFKNMFKNNMNCPLCEHYSESTHYDDQASLLTCPVIQQNKELSGQIETIKYSDIFRSVEYQISAIKVLEKVLQYRISLLNDMT